MKKWLWNMAALTVLAASTVYIIRKKEKPLETPEEENTMEKQFRKAWTEKLQENASVFCGLYNSLLSIDNGFNKRPEKVLREWCQRTHYNWEGEEVDLLCQSNIQPLVDILDREALSKWAQLLLQAAAMAGILAEEEHYLVISEDTVDDYIEWSGEKIHSGDDVKILSPAWYQNDVLIDQGVCQKMNDI